MPLVAPAARLDYFLLIDHIKGESQDSQHPDEIDIKNWAWGLSNSGSPHVGGGGGAGKPSFLDFSWSQGIDKRIVPIFMGVATGEHIRSARLDVVKDSGYDAASFFQMVFEDVLLTELQFTGTAAGPSATGKLDYGKVKLRYRVQKADGSYAPWIEGAFDVTKNTIAFTGDPNVLLGVAAAGGQLSLAVPEPPAWALMLGGLLATGTWLRRRAEG